MAKETEASEQQLDFDGQRPGEEVLFVFRRHLIVIRKGFYMLLVPLVITSIPVLIWPSDPTILLLPLGGLIIGLALFFYQFILWYFTVYIVTNQRIRQVTQRGLFGKDVVELQLSKIQNISYNIPGFGGEVLKFGTIVIQTIVGDLVINRVEHPNEVYNKLQDAVSATMEGKKSSETNEEDIE